MQNPIKFEQYKTNVGYFVKAQSGNPYPYSYSRAKEFILNEITEHVEINDYVRLTDELTSVKKTVKGQNKLVHYKLKDEELACTKLPLIADEYWNEIEDALQAMGVEGYESLYQPVYHQEEDAIVEIPFEVITIGSYEIEEPNNIKSRKIKSIENSGWNDKVIEQELSAVVIYDDITKLLTPEFALNQAPCKLSSKQMYSITRQFIKENLDMKENRITSDYDFCFTVKKVVHTKPFLSSESYLKGKSWKERKVTKQDKLVDIFEMTWKGYKGNSGYEGYTCIDEMKGENLQDLSNNLDEYLNSLICNLNKKVEECECCKGYGMLVQKA